MYKIFADSTLIYDSTLDDYKIGKGTITLESDKSGSFVFSLYPDHFFYDGFVRLKTVVSVYKDNRIVFRGRVLSDVTDYWNNKVLTCEGELGFLQDSIIRPYSLSGTPESLFRQLIELHNEQVDEFKRFNVGTVTVTGASTTLENTEYNSAMETLTNGPLLSVFPGHFYITHGDDGQDETPTLHYLADFTAVSSQAIEFGVNLKQYTKTVKAEEIATAIIPLGTEVEIKTEKDPETGETTTTTEETGNKLTIESVNGGKDYVYSTEGVAMYGWIIKVLDLPEITDAATLKAKAEEHLLTSVNQNTTVELTAVDLHLLDRSIDSYKVGQYIQVRSIPHNFAATLLCNKQTLDLLKPENDSVTLGHTYYTFTERTNKVQTAASGASGSLVLLNKTAAATSQNSASIVDIIARLDALEGVTVLINVSDSEGALGDLLNSLGVLFVAGQSITQESTSKVIFGGNAEIRYTATAALATARNVLVNDVPIGTVSTAGQTVSTSVAVTAGTVINIAFTS